MLKKGGGVCAADFSAGNVLEGGRRKERGKMEAVP